MNWNLHHTKHFSAEHLQKVNKRDLPEDLHCEPHCMQRGARDKRRTRSVV